MRNSIFILFVTLITCSCTLERNAQYGYQFDQKIRSKNNLEIDVPQQSSLNLVSLPNAPEHMNQTDVHDNNALYQNENSTELIPLEEIGSYGMRLVKKSGTNHFGFLRAIA
jgi:hypothetical protein